MDNNQIDFPRNLDYENWNKIGFENGYDQRNPYSLNRSKSKIERRWYSRGLTQKWLSFFPFKRKKRETAFQGFEEWEQYGIEMNYNERNPASLNRNGNKTEVYWYKKGSDMGWLDKFSFKRLNESPSVSFNSFAEWKQYGNDNNYQARSPSNLNSSNNINDRSWYVKGCREGWIKDFPMQRKKEKFKNFEEWAEFGKKKGFHLRNPKGLAKSKNPDERSWHIKGAGQRWLRKFKFDGRLMGSFPYSNFTEWREYGLEHEFDKRNARSISCSDKKDERSWHGKGYREGWLRSFSFVKLVIRVDSVNLLETILDGGNANGS